MRTIESGHRFVLTNLDFTDESDMSQELVFVKRIGEKYPGNLYPPHPGTTIQEVIRALIARCEYVHWQIPCIETKMTIGLLKTVIALLEIRAKRVKGKHLNWNDLEWLHFAETCEACGHIECKGECRLDNKALPSSSPSPVEVQITHGTLLSCPTCSSPGRFDATKSETFAFPNAIWLCPDGSYECYDCYLK